MPSSAEVGADEMPVVGKELSFVVSDLSEESLASMSACSAYEAQFLTLEELSELVRLRRALFEVCSAELLLLLHWFSSRRVVM